MDQRGGPAAGDVGVWPGDRLEDRAGDRMVAADRDGQRAGGVEPLVERLDMDDRDVVDHRLGQRHVAHVVDPADLPGHDAEVVVGAPVETRDVAHGARRQVLVALGRAVARAVRHADQRDVAVGRVLVMRAAEQGRHAPPVPIADRLPCLLEPRVVVTVFCRHLYTSLGLSIASKPRAGGAPSHRRMSCGVSGRRRRAWSVGRRTPSVSAPRCRWRAARTSCCRRSSPPGA